MNALTLAILRDLITIMSDKEAVQLADPTATVVQPHLGRIVQWVGRIDGVSEVWSDRSSGDCWRRAKIAVLQRLDSGWIPSYWNLALTELEASEPSDRVVRKARPWESRAHIEEQRRLERNAYKRRWRAARSTVKSKDLPDSLPPVREFVGDESYLGTIGTAAAELSKFSKEQLVTMLAATLVNAK